MISIERTLQVIASVDKKLNKENQLMTTIPECEEIINILVDDEVKDEKYKKDYHSMENDMITNVMLGLIADLREGKENEFSYKV